MTLLSHIICCHIFMRLCLGLVLLLPGLLQSYAASAQTNVNIAAYLCNQTVAAAPSQAEEALRDLLILAGQIEPDVDIETPRHCENCVLTAFALPTFQSQLAVAISYTLARDYSARVFQILVYSAQGPPIGGRAPPTFS